MPLQLLLQLKGAYFTSNLHSMMSSMHRRDLPFLNRIKTRSVHTVVTLSGQNWEDEISVGQYPAKMVSANSQGRGWKSKSGKLV